MVARLQDGPPRTALASSTPTRLLGSSLSSTTPASSSSNSSSPSPSDTSSHKKQRELAHSLAQPQSCPQEEGPGGRGLAPRSLENRAGGPRPCSEEPSTPPPVAIGTGEPGGSMKTTFTIEIKDGRGQASTGRVLLPTGNQRAGRLLTAGMECLHTHPQLLVLHARQVLRPVSRVWLTLTGIAHTPPGPNSSPLPSRIDSGIAGAPNASQHQQWGQEHHHPHQQPWDCDPTGQCHSRHYLQPCLSW